MELAVYDLSRGMAQVLSPQILGEAIEGIWHTGLVVFGREWFFGGGIQVLPRGQFAVSNGLHPLRYENLGETSRTESELLTFLGTIRSRFTQQTYDLLRNNCNNFSDVVSNFLLGRGIPSYIVDLPNRVLSTPGGQALRPIFESMQGQVQRMTAGDPFAHMASASSSSSSVTNFGASSSGGSNAGYVTTQVVTVTPRPQLKDAALVGLDSSAVTALATKITTALSSEEQKTVFSNVVAAITATTPFSVEGEAVKSVLTPSTFDSLTAVFRDRVELRFAVLYIARLLLPAKELPAEALSLILSLTEALSSSGVELSKPVRVLALASIANYYNHPRDDVVDDATRERIIDASLGNFLSEHVEVRQAASALCNNVALHGTKEGGWGACVGDAEMNPHALQLLCGASENIHTENDATCRLRRLTVAYRLLSRASAQGKELAAELGLADFFFRSLQRVNNERASEAEEKVLLDNLCLLLTSPAAAT